MVDRWAWYVECIQDERLHWEVICYNDTMGHIVRVLCTMYIQRLLSTITST